MAIRRAAARPDETGMVSREAHVQAFMDLEAMMWVAGGVGSVIADRTRTDVPGEMVTTFLVAEWKDRTDAKPAAEAESHDLAAATAPAPTASLEALANPLEALAEQLGIPVEDLAKRIAGDVPVPVAVTPNGDSPDDEPEEDLSSIPEHLR